MCYGSVCSGIEAASIAWEPLGMRPAWFAEIEPFPSAVLALRWPHVANLGDMTKLAKKVLAGEIESPDVLVGGTPCFTAGHMVLCKNGYKPIEDVCPGDYVVSHLGRLQQVKRVGSKIANTGLLNAVGQPLGIRTTNDHPFLAVRWKAQNTRKNGTYFKRELLSEPEWRAACDMPGYQWCALTNFNIASPDICSRFLSEEQAMYLAGAYVGDGYIRRWRGKSKKAVVFGINCQKLRKFHCRIPENMFSVASEIRGSIKVTLNDTCYANWLNEHFGELSHAKRIPAWVMSHPLRHVFLQGYLDTDGTPSGKAGFRINSVSPALAWGVAGLSQTCGYVSSVSFIEVEPKKVIEDRVVNQRNYYQVTICPQKLSRKSRLAHGMLLRTVKEFKSVGLDTVYNIEVEGDHSYILNGAVVHNCQAFSIAGLRGGLDDERGALTLKYVELANAIDDKRAESFLKPAVIVWENVPGVLSSADNAFGCFLAGLAGEDVPFEPGDRPESGKSNAFWRWDGKTGCHVPKWPQCGCIYGPQRKVAWRILDAQYFGVAQRRRRVFVVASARTDLDPATVLFEFEGVRRNIAPSRKKKEIASAITANGAAISGESLNPCLHAGMSPGMKSTKSVNGFRMAAFGEYIDDETASTVKARDFKDATDLAVFSSTGAGFWSEGHGTLRAREQESHEHLVTLAFPERMSGTQHAATKNTSPSLSALVGSSPEALDTLNELAAALGNDPNFATTMTNALAGKQPLDATLTALAALATGANKLPYFTGKDTVAQTDLTSVGRDILAKTSTLAVIQYLGLRELGTSGEKIPLLSTANTWSARQTFNGGITGALTGNADTATKLKTARNINGVRFDGSGDININTLVSRGRVTALEANAQGTSGIQLYEAYNNGYPSPYGNVLHLKGATAAGEGELFIGWSGTSGDHAPVHIRSRRDTDSANWSEWAQVYTSKDSIPGVNAKGDQDTSGNAATATKLQTARTINGVSFDGSKNIELTAENLNLEQTVELAAGSLQKNQNGADIHGKDTFTKNIGACRAFHSSISTGAGNWTTAQLIEWLDSQGAFNHPYWMCKCSWSYGNNKIITDTGCGTIHLAGCVIEVMGNKGAMTIRVTTPSTSTGGGTTNAQFTYINHGADYAPGWRRDYSTKNQQPAFALGQTGSTVGNDKAVGWNSISGVYNANIGGASTLILHFYMGAGSCPAVQFRVNYKNGGIYYRSARDGYGFEADWSEFYTTTRKPSAGDVGAYTKAECNSRFITGIRLGTKSSVQTWNGPGWNDKSGYVVTASINSNKDELIDTTQARPVQYCINGTWYNAGSI
nr:DNA cytosine methyltransferase [Escherichia coli]